MTPDFEKMAREVADEMIDSRVCCAARPACQTDAWRVWAATQVATALRSAYTTGRNDAKEEDAAAIAKVRSWYDETIFSRGGEHLDAASARMARLTCDNIRKEIDDALSSLGETKS